MSDNTFFNRVMLLTAALDKFYSKDKDKNNDGLIRRDEVNTFVQEFKSDSSGVLEKLNGFAGDNDQVDKYFSNVVGKGLPVKPTSGRVSKSDIDQFIQLTTGNNYENWQELDWDGFPDSDVNVDGPWWSLTDSPDDMDVSEVAKKTRFYKR